MNNRTHLLMLLAAPLLLTIFTGCAGSGSSQGLPRNHTLPAKTSAFLRATPETPLEVVKIYYESENRIDDLERRSFQSSRKRAEFDSPLGNFEYGITTGGKKFREAAIIPPYTFVVGDPGERFGIYVKNNTSRRMEAVISVDGLDVVDGQPAAFGKRGYIINPGEKLYVEGWRRDLRRIMEMRFKDLRAKEANTGVIGIAVFADQQ